MKNILLIGNELEVAELTSRVIKKYGFSVDIMTDETGSVKKIPDLIIFDNDMPPENGMKKYKNVIEKYNSAKILWISGDETDEVPALKSGADEWIKKPIKMDVLIARLNNLQRRVNKV